MEDNEREELKSELKTKHRELMRWLASGSTHAEAAARTGISKVHVTRLANSDLFKAEMKLVQDELDREVYEKTKTTLVEIQEENLQAAKDNLIVRIEIRDKDVESPSSRLKACDAIDRVAGIVEPEAKGNTLTIGVDDGLKAAFVDYTSKLTGVSKGDKSDKPDSN